MPSKIRLIRTTILEFEPNPRYYPEGSTIEEMAEIEANQEDINLLFDSEDVVKDEVVWEIIK